MSYLDRENGNDEPQRTSISKARTLEEIADFWDTHSLADYWDQTHEVAFEVSANCTHIAGGRVRGIVENINNMHGFATPIICTPEELMEV